MQLASALDELWLLRYNVVASHWGVAVVRSARVTSTFDLSTGGRLRSAATGVEAENLAKLWCLVAGFLMLMRKNSSCPLGKINSLHCGTCTPHPPYLESTAHLATTGPRIAVSEGMRRSAAKGCSGVVGGNVVACTMCGRFAQSCLVLLDRSVERKTPTLLPVQCFSPLRRNT
ncbi:hypothetical protein CCHOA_11835 [Corynebacterium choanae]|uniref:Uncharacterized protein n=1 Tax=Corynebacterium choanae TaxID=1862358 RepID=A0A3G6JCF2_9CORY|nr:hypothetical protein CCHOA_11835 [Corynebacterium choanae]